MEAEPEWSDSTIIIELLLDVRARVTRIEALLEDDDEEKDEDDA